MSALNPVILPAIVIDDSNDAIEMTEHGVTETVFIEHRTYYLSGDEEVDDLMTGVVEAMNSHSNATDPNGYTKTGSFVDGNSANKSGGVVLGRATGGSSFALLWSHDNTTFDASLLGFDPDVDTADSLGSKTGTLSPAGWWVCPERYVELEPEDEQDAKSKRARSGRVRGTSRGPRLDVRRLSFEWIAAKRTHQLLNSADPDAAFSQVLGRLKVGRPFELHLVDHAGGAITAFFDTSTEHGSGWHLSSETAGDPFDPDRHSPAVDLYGWALRLWGRV